MRNEYKQNLIVGLFVLIGLIVLGVLIILFGEAPYAFTPSYKVTMIFPSAGPVNESDPVLMNGIQIGFVKSIEPMDDIRKGVKAICMINTKYRIPIDAEPLIKEQTIALGKPAIRINVGPENSKETLPTDGNAVLYGYVAGGIEELIPKETMKQLEEAGSALIELAQSLKPVVKDLHTLFKPLPVQRVDTATGPARPLANISTVVQRFDQALKNLNEVLGTHKTKQDLRLIVENFRVVSEKGIVLADRLNTLADRLNTLTERADDNLLRVSRAIMENADKLGKLLSELNKLAYKLNEGEGSAGRFLNDPKLYEALTVTVRKLQLALDELHKLIIQWKVKGVKFEGGLLGK